MNKYFYYILILSSFVCLGQTNIQIGDSLYVLQDYKKAASFYEKDTSLKGKLQLAKTYKALGDIPSALFLYDALVQKHPEKTIAVYQYANLLSETKKYKKADSLYAKLYQEFPDNVNYLFQRGVIQEKQGDTLAFKSYIVVLEKDSLFSNANYKMARNLVQRRKFDAAKKYIDNGLAVYKESKRFLVLKGLYYHYLELDYKAVAVFEKLLALGHANEQIHETLADSYFTILAFNKAIEQYATLLMRYNDTNPLWHYKIGSAYYAIRNYEKAIVHINMAITIKAIPLDTEYIKLAQIYKRQKNYQKVFEMMGLAVIENNASEMLRYQHAIAADSYFKDIASILNYYQIYLDRFPKGRFSALAKQRMEDLKMKQHLERED